MGFGFGSLKKIFSKKGLSHLAVAAGSGGMLPGFAEAQFFEGGQNATESVMKGIGNLVSGGYISQKEATEEAKKARDQSKDQYAEQEAAVMAETQRLADLDEEKKRRAAQAGTTNPQTLLGGYKGPSGSVNTYRALLGA